MSQPFQTYGLRPRSRLRRAFDIYAGIGTVYFIWVMIILQFRECGIFGQCAPVDVSGSMILRVVTTLIPQVVLYSLQVAFFRALLWLPNLIIAVLQGGFVDSWLLVRDTSMVTLMTALTNLLP